jgi:TPP-dependent pyruvate/acetoin dehydrogenase alpha subunit
MNQGMALEAINLAVVWQLPAIFVCKDDQWAITTPSANTTVANLAERARGFGMPAIQVDGSDVEAVWFAAREAFTRARQGGGPTFLHASCSHLEGHFLGYILLRLARKPSLQMLSNSWPLLKSLFYSKGAPFRQRLQALFIILNLINQTQAEHSAMSRSDPLVRARLKLLSEPPRLEDLENGVRQEINQIFESALNTSSFDKGG